MNAGVVRDAWYCVASRRARGGLVAALLLGALAGAFGSWWLMARSEDRRFEARVSRLHDVLLAAGPTLRVGGDSASDSSAAQLGAGDGPGPEGSTPGSPITERRRRRASRGVMRDVHHVVVDARLLRALGRVADTATVEHLRCLVGSVAGDTLELDGARTPEYTAQTPMYVAHQGCPSETVAVWHVHLRFANALAVPQRRVPADQKCYFSDIDRETALQPGQPPIWFVQVTGQVWCGWARHRVAGADVLVPLRLSR